MRGGEGLDWRYNIRLPGKGGGYIWESAALQRQSASLSFLPIPPYFASVWLTMLCVSYQCIHDKWGKLGEGEWVWFEKQRVKIVFLRALRIASFILLSLSSVGMEIPVLHSAHWKGQVSAYHSLLSRCDSADVAAVE